MKIKVKTIKVGLGIFTFFTALSPLIMMVIFFLDFLQTTESFDTEFPFGYFLFGICYSISQLVLQVYYIVLVIKNKQLSDSTRILFVIGIFFLPYISMPLYFIVRIWNDDSQFIDVLRKKTNKFQHIEKDSNKISKMETEIPKLKPKKKIVQKTKQDANIVKESNRSKK